MRKRHIMTSRVKLRALTVYQVLTQMMFPWNLGLCVRRGRNRMNLVRLDAAMQKGTCNTIQGRDSCMSCAAGTFAEHGGAMSCAPCVAGKFSGNGSSVCSKCPIDTFAVRSSAACTVCPVENTTLGTGSESLDDWVCPTGAYFNSSICITCAHNTYKESISDNTYCDSCNDRITYSTGSKLICSCVCPAGTEEEIINHPDSPCNYSTATSYNSNNNGTCLGCPANSSSAFSRN